MAGYCGNRRTELTVVGPEMLMADADSVSRPAL
jgi:hypothetical protein